MSKCISCPKCDWKAEYDADEWQERVARSVDAEIHWTNQHMGPVPDSANFGDYQCPCCHDMNGMNGSVSCSECGHIPLEARA